MNMRNRLRESSSLVGGALAALLAASPALSQTTTPATQDEGATQVEEVIVTGSRIPKNEFTSASPVQVITSERAQARGLSDTAQMLQSSTVAAGSP